LYKLPGYFRKRTSYEKKTKRKEILFIMQKYVVKNKVRRKI